jgi:hypothetical protein
MVFISILRSRGFENLIDVKGGMNELKKMSELKLTDYVCPTTLL